VSATRLDLRWAVDCEGVMVAAFAWEWQADGYVARERRVSKDWTEADSGNSFAHKLSVRDRRKPRRGGTR
jgi:hypothetical protein